MKKTPFSKRELGFFYGWFTLVHIPNRFLKYPHHYLAIQEKKGEKMKTKNCRYPLFLTIGLIMVTLWSAHSLQAATNIKVSGVMPLLGDIDSFQISPNGRYAVYLADQDTDGVLELYSVLLDGGSPVRLNPPLLLPGRNVTSFRSARTAAGWFMLPIRILTRSLNST